ncbi:FkbM family methyltransferase [Bradyrhizobium sp. RT3b]|uniref:FkbM family methyltransferase n=1 Tax=Bradyrhizobium sp. RT3b TaxID=3156334 RepID=UPI00339407B6
MSVWYIASLNFQDLTIFGPRILWRHVARLTGAKTARVAMSKIGTVELRPRESDISTFRDIFGSRDYAAYCYDSVKERLQAAYNTILKDGKTPVLVDAGANIGAASLWFRQKFPQLAIVAIEPDPDNIALLRSNLAGKKDVYILDAAIGATPGYAELARSRLSWATQTTRASSGTEIITVEDAVAQVPKGRLLVAKIDIEGFESDLFSSNTNWIDAAAMLIIEPHDWLLPHERTSSSFQKEMGARQFDIFVAGENIIYVRRDPAST